MPGLLSFARFLINRACAPFRLASLPLIPSRQSITALMSQRNKRLQHFVDNVTAVCSDIMAWCDAFKDPATRLCEEIT